MKGRLLWAIFWALVGVFVALASTIFIVAPVLGRLEMPAPLRFLFLGTLALLGTAIAGLGVTLLVLTRKTRVRGLLKKFFLLTGASAVGWPVFVLLHNLVFELFIYFFGEGFWDKIGLGDEPFFFMLAGFVCPLGFLVGAIGSIILGFKKSRSGS